MKRWVRRGFAHRLGTTKTGASIVELRDGRCAYSAWDGTTFTRARIVARVATAKGNVERWFARRALAERPETAGGKG